MTEDEHRLAQEEYYKRRDAKELRKASGGGGGDGGGSGGGGGGGVSKAEIKEMVALGMPPHANSQHPQHPKIISYGPALWHAGVIWAS